MINDRNQILGLQPNTMGGAQLGPQQRSGDSDGFEHIQHTEAYFEKLRFDNNIEQSISNYDDVGTDSHYPLMTSDPNKQKEFTVKITNKKLDQQFDQENKNKFNLQSIMIQDYIPTSASKNNKGL